MLDAIGGFDASFFAFGEDADVAWRARMAGWSALYAPASVAYHHGSATAGEASPAKYFLVGRNRMRLLAKNAPAGQLARWGWAMALYDLAYVRVRRRHRPHPRAAARPRRGAARVAPLPRRGRRRRAARSPSPRRPARSARGASARRTARGGAMSVPVPPAPSRRRPAVTLVLSPAPLGAELAGPGDPRDRARAARSAARSRSRTRTRPATCAQRAAAAGVVVAHPAWPLSARALRRSGARLIYDLYDPEPLEALQFLAGRRAGVRRTVTAMSLDRLVNALHDGHAFLCASERQRDLWTGTLLAQRLIAPAVHDARPDARRPAGGRAVRRARRAARSPATGRASASGSAPTDEIVLWNGGLWDWLDAESVLRAVARLSPERPRLRLVFMGASDAAQARGAEQRARALARDLGLLGRVVRFNDDWVPYAQRGAWLLQADCAVAAHHDHLETRFAHRTRLLDCLWAGLPVVCTRGDELAERDRARGPRRRRSRRRIPRARRRARAACSTAAARAYADRLAAAAARAALVARGRAARAARRGARGERAARRACRPAGGLGPPALRARDAAYVAARSVLNGVGRRDWPRVR